jgi:Sulfotransferase domain
MPLSVIGAGASRTGTLSLKAALEQLGFGPCHHFFELLANPSAWPQWDRVFSGARVDWDRVYDGYRSGVDAPTVWLWRELAERYPDAKVILTTRSPESWLRSVRETVYSQSNFGRLMSTPAAPLIAKAGPFLAGRQDALDPSLIARDPDAAIAGFIAHNEEVVRLIAPERLLVFEVKSGWEPLCGFLGVPVPQAPFPRANSAEDFQDWIKTGRVPAH